MRLQLPIVFSVLFLMVYFACSSSGSGDTDESNSDSMEDPTDKEPKEEDITLADPTIFYDEDSNKYYLYGTSGSDLVQTGFEVYVSTDLENWERQDQLALHKNETFGNGGFWAPQVFKHEGKYYMAYTADEHIAIAESDSPLGPFKQNEIEPIHDEDYNTIDPYVFIDEDGDKYLYYVRLGGGNWSFAAEMEDDFSDIIPETAESAINAVENPQDWENMDENTAITEGPTIINHKGVYYFFYSANHFENPYYSVGYATSENPMGEWEKFEDNPILSKDFIDQNGTGHGDFFRDKHGDYYYVFHTHNSEYEIQPRLTAIIKGEFVSNEEGEDAFKFDAESFRFLTAQIND